MKEIIVKKISENFKDAILDTSEFRNDLSILVKKESLLGIAQLLHNDAELQFDMCKDVTAIDWAKRKDRFTLVYHLYSFSNKFELRLKVNIDEADAGIVSLSSVWKSADWYERETLDMYGIRFTGHSDLRRIYMPEEFEYYPLRKDFPLLGIPGSLPLPKSGN
jgi:NADH-quinone oxidoreductase subunit C